MGVPPTPIRVTYKSGRHFLQLPGPTNVPERVLRAMSRPTIDHRGPEFQKLTERLLTEQDKEESERRLAIDTLALFGTAARAAAPALEELLDDPGLEFAAKNALKKINNN